MKNVICLITLFSLLTYSCSYKKKITAKNISLSEIYSSGMVIKCSPNLTLSGKAEPDSKLAIRIYDYVKIVNVDEKGSWETMFPEIQYNKPFSIRIEGVDTTITLNNVISGEIYAMIGDAYLSPLQNHIPSDCRKDNPVGHKGIRIYQRKESDHLNLHGAVKWLPSNVAVNTPKTCSAVSAVSKVLADSQNPVGIIDFTYPGSTITSWSKNENDDRNINYAFHDSLITAKNNVLTQILSMKDTCRNGIKKGALKLWHNEMTWRNCTLPITFTKDVNNLEKRLVYLRRKIYIPEKYLPSQFEIGLEYIHGDAEFYFNETRVEATLNEFSKYKLIIADSLLKPFTNILAVRLFTGDTLTGFYGNNFYCINSDTSYNVKLNEGWKYNINLEDNFPVYEPVEQNAAVAYKNRLMPLMDLPVDHFIWYGSYRMAKMPPEDLFNKMISIGKLLESEQKITFISNKISSVDTLLYDSVPILFNNTIKKVAKELNADYFEVE